MEIDPPQDYAGYLSATIYYSSSYNDFFDYELISNRHMSKDVKFKETFLIRKSGKLSFFVTESLATALVLYYTY